MNEEKTSPNPLWDMICETETTSMTEAETIRFVQLLHGHGFTEEQQGDIYAAYMTAILEI